MASNEYHFITHWRVKGSLQEVAEILNDAESLPRWWPSVYLDVRVLKKGDEHGLGKVVWLYTKGWLPYTLRWQFCVTKISASGFTLVAEGDLVGRGIWTFAEEGEWTNITYDWKIEATKPLLRYFSFLFKPIFAMNHQWAMRQGEISLALELRRRRPRVRQEEPILAPPSPTPSNPLRWLVFVVNRRGRAPRGTR
jgi:hypothetical protein